MDRLSSEIEYELSREESEEQPYRVYTREHDVVEVPEPRKDFDPAGEMNKLRPYLSGLLRRLVQTLRGRKEMRWQRGRSRGRLDPGALHRLSVGRSSRIFRKRKISEGGRTACTLLLDLSSSMDGDQIRMARRLALIFGEVLSRIGYPTEIIGFSTIDRNLRYEVSQQTGEPTEELAKKYTRMVPLYHALLKQFGEPWRRAAARMGSVRCQALTPLGESLLFAGKRLASRPEYRKALFCLTDGQPVVGAWDESVTMQHACRAVERLEGVAIEPVGIGIMADCVQKIFPRNAVIHRLEELPRTFAGELCEVLTERKRAGSA